jgi:hypothetical protein
VGGKRLAFLFTSESITSFSGLPFPTAWTPLSPAAAADGAVKNQDEGICQYGTNMSCCSWESFSHKNVRNSE